MKGRLIKTDVNYILEDDKGVVIASTSLKRVEGLSLSIKNCQVIECGYDLDDIKRKVFDGFDGQPNSFTIAAVEQTIQIMVELMNDDVFNWLEKKGYLSDDKDIIKKEYTQQTEWDVDVVMVPALSNNGNVYYGDIPKLDADGCLILKRI